MSSEHPAALERELESCERLTADISSRFSYLPVDEVPGAIEDTLHRIVEHGWRINGAGNAAEKKCHGTITCCADGGQLHHG